ncbi:MAG: 2-oxoacid:ferredoxin oxidoreductase subunit beta [Candidatus Bathyarchaeia archaeon]
MITEKRNVEGEVVVQTHPKDELIRAERFPHIWCPGCGLGIVLKCYVEAVAKSSTPPDKHVCVSGIGCTSRMPGYMNLDTYHTTHGRAIPFATGIKIVNPELKVTVVAGDGDLFNIGGNHIIHAARRNMDLTVLCVNNFNYGMTGGQHGSTTPVGARTSTTPYGSIEHPFNIPNMVASLGAPYVARWTTIHVRQLVKAISHALEKDGFGFVEILSPCPPTFGELNAFPEGLDEMEYFRKYSVHDDNANLKKVGLAMKEPEPIVVGNFVDERKPSFIQLERALIEKVRSGQR